MFMPVVKEAIRVRSADEIGPAVARAIQTAARAAGTAGLRGDPDRPAKRRSWGLTPSFGAFAAGAGGRPTRSQLDRALDLLERARRPLIWAGGGALQSGAGEAVGAARRAARGAGHPHLLGAGACCRPATPASSEPRRTCPRSARSGTRPTWWSRSAATSTAMMTQGWKQPQPPHLVAINVDPTDASKNYRPDVVVEADAARGRRRARRTGSASAAGSTRSSGACATSTRASATGSRPRSPRRARFLDAIEAALPDDAVVVCDMCIPGYWLGGFHRTPAPRKLSYPLGWGTLGCAFPQGLGAALAGAGPAVSISGDGGFLYACGELAAAKQENIPLTAVIVDDGGYGMIRYDQDLHGDPREGVDLTNPDFVALAASFGIRADSVDGLGEHFAMALKGHVALKEPTMLVARAALGPPPNVSPALVPAMSAEEPSPGGPGEEPRVRAAPGEPPSRPRSAAPPSASRRARELHRAGRRGLAGGHSRPARAHHGHGAADPPDVGRRLARVAHRDRAGRALHALLRAHLRRHHARPHRRRAPAARGRARHRRVGGHRDRRPARVRDRHRHLADRRRHAASRCSPRRSSAAAPLLASQAGASAVLVATLQPPGGLRLHPRPRRPGRKRPPALRRRLAAPARRPGAAGARGARPGARPARGGARPRSPTRSSSATRAEADAAARRRRAARPALRPASRDARRGRRRRAHLARPPRHARPARALRRRRVGEVGLAIEDARALARGAARAIALDDSTPPEVDRRHPRAGRRRPRAGDAARGRRTRAGARGRPARGAARQRGARRDRRTCPRSTSSARCGCWPWTCCGRAAMARAEAQEAVRGAPLERLDDEA